MKCFWKITPPWEKFSVEYDEGYVYISINIFTKEDKYTNNSAFLANNLEAIVFKGVLNNTILPPPPPLLYRQKNEQTITDKGLWTP